jgi:hypothetical protein
MLLHNPLQGLAFQASPAPGSNPVAAFFVNTAVLFAVPSFAPCSPQSDSPPAFLTRTCVFCSVLQRMLRRNPLQALALHRPPAAPVVDRLDGASDDESENAALDSAAVLIANRRGGVLGPHTVLKEDHFPGCQAPRVPANVPGAPNFWGVPNHNVYGSALPTVEGVRGVLEAVGCAPAVHNREGEEVGKVLHFSAEPPPSLPPSFLLACGCLCMEGRGDGSSACPVCLRVCTHVYFPVILSFYALSYIWDCQCTEQTPGHECRSCMTCLLVLDLLSRSRPCSSPLPRREVNHGESEEVYKWIALFMGLHAGT